MALPKMSALRRRINFTVTLTKLTQVEIKQFIIVFMQKYLPDFKVSDSHRVYGALEVSSSHAGAIDKFTIDWVKRRLTAAITETVYDQEPMPKRKRSCQEHRGTGRETPSLSRDDVDVFLQKVAHPRIQ